MQNEPTIYLYGDSSNGSEETAKVRIAYTRERQDGGDRADGDWICRNVGALAGRPRSWLTSFSATSITMRRGHDASNVRHQELVSALNNALGIALTDRDVDTGTGGGTKAINVGDSDASLDNTPSQFLLLRGLEPSVSEELLAKGVAKLNKPTGSATQAKPLAGKRGAKVSSTTGENNLGAREGSLRRILLVRNRKSNDSWRFGFAEYAAVEDAQAALTRYASFDKFTIASKTVMASYVHAGVFVPVLNASAAIERFTFSPLTNPNLKLMYWDEDAYVTELVLPEMVQDQQESLATSLVTATAEKEGLKSTKDVEKGKKRKVDVQQTNAAGTKKAPPSQLQFWSSRHAELHGIEKKPTDAGTSTKAEADVSSADSTTLAPAQSFADSERLCCYLCSRKFKSVAEVNKHERLSDLHRQNLGNDELVAKAKKKLQKHESQLQQQTNNDYRDRAKERRKLYGVVNKKGEQVGIRSQHTKDDEVSAVVQSKGAALLSKMGYAAGSGLGASGSGRTAPINQDVYMAGVGLGAEGGKVGDAVTEAERNTKGDYSGFAEKTRQGARERYSHM